MTGVSCVYSECWDGSCIFKLYLLMGIYWTANDHSPKVKKNKPFDMILGPSVFTFLSVPVLSVYLYEHCTPQFSSHKLVDPFRYLLYTARWRKKNSFS